MTEPEKPSREIVREKPYRSLLKAISWRTLATFDTTLISFLITGSLKWALSIGVLEVFTKMALYYFHERAWSKSRIGIEIIPPPDYTI